MTESPIAETSSGRVRGIHDAGVCVFKGIAYGGLTEGTGRFMPPSAVIPWTGVRDALDYGHRAMQDDDAFGLSPELLQLIALREPQPMNENCLVLNVWTPALNDGVKRPVMFWCHGGAFIVGSGASPWYEGASLSRKGDVVVVTINHRLGAFGYLHLLSHPKIVLNLLYAASRPPNSLGDPPSSTRQRNDVRVRARHGPGRSP